MAESNATQVILTDDGIKIIKAQNTANNAASGVTDLNDPNLMSVIEKQYNISQFAGLTSQYDVLVQNAKDDGVDTTAVTTAYNNLNRFMADILADPDHASDVDRVTYKKYQDAYNEELAKLQSALQNNTNNKFTSAASALSQAASTANVAKSAADSTYAYANSEIAVQSTATAKAQSAADGAFSQAQVVGSQAGSAIAVQSTATAKAQSAADNAFSQAQVVGSQASVEISKNSMATAKAQSTADNAFNKAQEVGNQASSEIAVQSEAAAKAQNTADNAFSKAQAVGSQASAEINSNSTATAKAQSTADNAFSQATTAIDNGKVTSQAVTDLKDGSKLTIAELENGLATKVANSDYASYKEQTASQIGQLVTNGAFSAYQTQTADLIAQKVATSDFSAYQATTAKSIESKVESKDFNTYKSQTADLINDKVSNSEYASDKTQTASQISQMVSNSAFSAYQTQTASQIAQTVSNSAFSAYQRTTADLIASKVATKDFSAYQATTAKSIESKVESSDFNTYKTQTADLIDDKVSNSAYASDKTQTASEIADRVSNSAFSTYQTQTASQIASKVDNGDFNTYKTQTANLIAEKVANKDFSAYQATTAKAIESKVESKDFNTYKTQTDSAISSKVESSNFQALQTQVNNSSVGTNLLLDTSDYSNNWWWSVTPNIDNTQNPAILHYPSTTLTSGLSVIAQQDIGTILQPSTTYTASFYAKGSGSFKFYCYPGVAATISSVNGIVPSSTSADCHTTIPLTSNYVRYTITFTTSSNISGSKTFLLRQDYNSSDASFNTVEAYVYGMKLEKGSVATDWSLNPEDQATQSQITQLSGEIEQKVDNGDFSSYKAQTDKSISEMVTNGDFSTYKEQTANLIGSKVDNGDFSSYKTQTDKDIASKVSSGDFNTYKTQTANLISSKVENGDFTTYKEQTAKDISSKVSSGDFSSYKTETAKLIGSKVDNGDFSTYKTQTSELISQKVTTKDFKSYQDTTAKEIASKVASGDFNSYKTQTDQMIASKVSKKDANNVNLIPYSSNFSDSLEGWQLMAWGATDRKLSAVTHNFYKNGTEKVLFLNTAQNATSSAGSLRFSVLPNTKYTFQFKAFASSNVVGANVYFLSRAYGSTKDYDTVHQLFSNLVTSPLHIDQYTVTFTTGANDNEGYIRVDNIGSNNGASSGLFFTELKMEPGDTATNYIYGGQDSVISQMSDDINLRVTKDGLISQINVQAKNTLISSGGQLTLSGKNVYFDTANPVIIPSANIDKLLVGKKLTAADISANTFSTNNETFTVRQDGSITAKNMTLIGGTLTSPTINASTINGATLNMQTDGLISSPYNGIVQTADQFYHPWKLNTGQLTIGQGYITSVSSGTRSINGVPKQFNSLQGTLSASYLKFTNDFGNRTYIDADMITCSSPTAQVAINSTGNIGINMGTKSAPALTISSGYIDASSSSSYGTFGNITVGYDPHTINSDSSLFFESGHGSGNPGINLWARAFHSLSSRLSTKRQVRLLDDEHSNSLLLGADTATFQYNQATNAENSNESVIIDDINKDKQYGLPDELITRDGKAPTDLMSFIARIISQNKYQARLIEDLQIRLRKVEIKNEQ